MPPRPDPRYAPIAQQAADNYRHGATQYKHFAEREAMRTGYGREGVDSHYKRLEQRLLRQAARLDNEAKYEAAGNPMRRSEIAEKRRKRESED